MRGEFGRLGSIALSRRGLLAVGAFLLGGLPASGQLVDKDPPDLKPGEYTWNPDRSGQGPLAIIVSIPDQRVYVYRNGVMIAASTCSTGKPGHSTPAGVFTILQKDKHHHSSTYNNAPMPNMNRLTWSGVALHAGDLPGYPASHGCVRLPLEFSVLLFGLTHVGTPVIIATDATQPKDVSHPGMVLSQYAENEFQHAVTALKDKSLPAATPEENTVPPVSVVISSADKRGYLLENGVDVASGNVVIADPAQPLGSHVFILSGADEGQKGLAWHAVGYHATDASGAVAPDADVIKRVQGSHDFIEAMKSRMHPGMTLVLTDEPASEETRTPSGFVVITHDEQPT